MPTLNLIGAGRAGQTLAKLWRLQHQLTVQAVVCQSLGHAGDAVSFIGAGQAGDSLNSLPAADLWLIATPDSQIGPVASHLAKAGVQGKVALHLSGSLDHSALSALAGCGLALASVHPICSFADPRVTCTTFPGTVCGVEGQPQALTTLRPLFEAIGARWLPIDGQRKALYHAASVMACNYLVTLTDAALQCLAKAGIPSGQGLPALLPLLQGTLDNLQQLPPAEALTGPIARSDQPTIDRHLQALQQDMPHLLPAYQSLGELTVRLADHRLTPAAREVLLATLKSNKP